MSEAYTTMASPVGELLLTAADGRLTGLYMPVEVHGPPAGIGARRGAFATVRRQLEEYFAGERRAFDLPVAPPGTPFQQRVWAELSASATARRSRTPSSPPASAGRPRSAPPVRPTARIPSRSSSRATA